MGNLFSNPFAIGTFILASGSVLVSIGIWIGKVNNDRDSFKSFMEEIEADFRQILQRLPRQSSQFASPLSLTPDGEKISEDLGAKEWAKQIARTLEKHAANKEPFEIHEITENYVSREFKPTDEMDRKIRSCIYEYGMKRRQITDVLQIELRDALLETTKQKKPSE